MRRRWAEAAPAVLAAGVVLLLHLAVSGRYGFHRDELYYVMAGRHPALGYVDQPAVVPLLSRLVVEIGGLHLWTLRAVAGIAHAALVIIAGCMARELGGDRWAVGVAAVATATAPVFMATGGMFQTVIFDQLWWALALLVVIRLRNGADVRWWLAVGALIGLGLETKWTIVLLGVGLVAGYVSMPEGREALRQASRWPLLGVAIAVALWAPNLAWQAANEWPTLEFTENNNANVLAEQGRLGFVLEQILLPGPVGFALAVAGLVWCWRRRNWRFLTIAAATIFTVLVVVGGKSYYPAPLYVLLFAAGAVATTAWATGRRQAWRVRVPTALVVAGLVTLPAVMAVLPASTYVGVYYDLNDESGEQLGWPELADQVAAVYRDLPPGQRADARIVTASYGEAAALDLYGPARGIAEGTVLSAHNSYADWWPDDEQFAMVIGVGYQTRALAPYCGSLVQVATIDTPADVPNRIAGTPVIICDDLQVRPDEFREALLHYQ